MSVEAEARKHKCPTCGAPEGARCYKAYMHPTKAHLARKRLIKAKKGKGK